MGKQDLEEKKRLFNKLRGTIPDKVLIKRLGLEAWQVRYALQVGEYSKVGEDEKQIWIKKISKSKKRSTKPLVAI